MRICGCGLIVVAILAFLIGQVCCTDGDEASTRPVVDLELVAEGLTAPLGFVSPGDGTGRMFVVDQIGVIMVVDDGALLEGPFMDLSDRMVETISGFDERGLLGLAFHPQFAQNGRLFVLYSAPLRPEGPEGWDSTIHVSEFAVFPDDQNLVDMDSERILLQIDTPQFNHNGGATLFGPDGRLYVSIGDGGGANDVGLGHPPEGNGQSTATLLGKILRIDVDSSSEDMAYAIPEDNPFVDTEGFRPEIFAYGLRNAYQISFDSGGDHELFAADVGQNLWEEVNIITKGENYGWNIREGTHCFDPKNPETSPSSCPKEGARGEPLIDPIIEYSHDLGTSVIGGYVYRGEALTELQGKYVFGDWSKGFEMGDGNLLVAEPAEEGLWDVEEIWVATNPSGHIEAFIRAFGQDDEGELYVLTSDIAGPAGNTGKVYKLVPPDQGDGS